MEKYIKKNVLIDCTAATQRITGIERYVRELAPRVALLLLEKGYRIVVALSDVADWWPNGLEQNVGLDVVYLPSSNRLAKDYVHLPILAKKSAVNSAWFPALPPSPFFFMAVPRCRVIRTVFDAVIWNHKDKLSLGNRFYYRPMEMFGIRHYEHIHTISEFSKGELVEYFPELNEKIIVSGIGVNSFSDISCETAVFHDWIDRLIGYRVLLFVSTLEPRKNLPFLLRVFEQILQQRSDIRLVLAGRFGWGAEEVKSLISDLNLNDDVILTGSVDDKTLSWLYKRADLFVFPSISEGFGLPIVEAMSAGLPVISSNAGALPEAAGDAAILLPPNELDAWVSNIRSLFDDPETRNSMIERGYKQATRFSWDAVAESIAATF